MYFGIYCLYLLAVYMYTVVEYRSVFWNLLFIFRILITLTEKFHLDVQGLKKLGRLYY